MDVRLSNEQSQRIDLLRFPLILGVIFIHNFNTVVGYSGSTSGVELDGTLSAFIIKLISKGMAEVAVPMFFLLAGYFFFSRFSLSSDSYKSKLSSRTRTLLIPYIFWNTAVLAMLLLVYSLPETKALAEGKGTPITAYGPKDWLEAYIGSERYPIAYQFWFIRDLFILCLASPLIYLAARQGGLYLVGGLFVIWATETFPIKIPDIQAVLFFTAGAVVQLKKLDLFYFDKYGKSILAFSALLLLTSTAFDVQSVHKISIVLGILGAFYLSQFMLYSQTLVWLLTALGTMSFFIFAAHEPTLNLVRKITYKFVEPETEWAVLSLYFINPIIVVLICVAAFVALRAITPRGLALISGGRV